MTRLLQAIRAKSLESGINPTLINHIKETLERAIKLREFIEQNKPSLTYEPFIEDSKIKEFFKSLFKALFLHDLGKINYKFQKKVYLSKEKEQELWNEIEEFFKLKNENNKDKIDYGKIDIPDHEVVSLLYTLFFLDNSEWDKKIRTAILLHHYNSFYTKNISNIRSLFSTYPDLEKYLKFLIKKYDDIKEFLGNLIEELIKYFEDNEIKEVLKEFREKLDSGEIKKRFENLKNSIKRGYGSSKIISLYKIPEEDYTQEWYDFFVFLGALRRCDYSASGDIKIEEEIDLGECLYNGLLERIKKSIKKENEKIWQEKVLEKNDSDNLILVAPTGSGKTEFALLWAAKRKRKLIYTLPLRVALNDLFWRFKSEDEREAYFNKEFVNILHSTSFIEYLKGKDEGRDIDVGTKVSGAKIFSSPLLLTTPDQVFLSSLKYYGFDKLLNIYPLSAIVIDEIQAYNPEMAAIIIKTLEIIKELNGNLLIITATLPPYFKKVLKDNKIIKVDKILDLKELTKEQHISQEEIKNYSIKRHKIKLIDKSLFDYDLTLAPKKEGFNEIRNIIKNNPDKNIMILVNNVGKAIEVYKLLTQYYKDSKNREDKKWKEVQKFFEDLELDNVELLHSRIIEKEKAERIMRIKKKIEEIKNKRDKGEKIEPKDRIILVATQIVEASVDVDFDVLITEISPIDSQIQRWGRIWRNRGEKDYEERNENGDIVPNIYIFTGIDKGTSVIYYPLDVLEKTLEVFKEKENNSEPFNYEEERELIEEVFKRKIKNVQTLKQLYENKISETLEWLKYYSAEKRSEAQKIFRNIAGIQVFVPNLPSENDEIYVALCEILKDKNNWNLPFESSKGDSIIGIIRNKLNNEKIDRWKILETLYKYSFNLPIFGLKSNKVKYEGLEKGNFKGFFVLKEDDEKILKEYKKFGVSSIKEILLDNLEIESNEENIIE